MTTLTEILKAKTQSLKVQYVETTKEWAKENYETMRAFVLDYRKRQNDDSSFSWKSDYKKYERLPDCVKRGDKEGYVEFEAKYAREHYEQSIKKLAVRIAAKGLNQDKLDVVTSHIGVNIETTLTDGEKTVRAFTVLAIGDINKPHYRYLIK